MKNTINYMATPNFFSIYCNGIKIKTSYSISKVGTAFNVKRAFQQMEELKWGVHRNAETQKRFDLALNK